MDTALLITVILSIVVGLLILALYKKSVSNSGCWRTLVASMVICAGVVIALYYGTNIELFAAVLVAFIWWSLSTILLGEHYGKA